MFERVLNIALIVACQKNFLRKIILMNKAVWLFQNMKTLVRRNSKLRTRSYDQHLKYLGFKYVVVLSSLLKHLPWGSAKNPINLSGKIEIFRSHPWHLESHLIVWNNQNQNFPSLRQDYYWGVFRTLTFFAKYSIIHFWDGPR